MMGPGFADGIGKAYALFFVLCMLGVGILTSLGWWLLPKLWAWLRPILAAWLA